MEKLTHDQQKESNYRQHYELYLKQQRKEYNDQIAQHPDAFWMDFMPSMQFTQFLRSIGVYYKPVKNNKPCGN